MFKSRNCSRRLTDRAASKSSPKRSHGQMGADRAEIANLLVSGFVKGDSKVDGTVTLSHSGRWKGDIEAVNAIIAGQVHGNLTVSEKLEIRKSARIAGSVRARSIAIAEGAIIEDRNAIACETPVVRFREKRKKDGLPNQWPAQLRAAVNQWVSIILNLH
jgi:cytoskeletal protein CcmA (bactofilin family)